MLSWCMYNRDWSLIIYPYVRGGGGMMEKVLAMLKGVTTSFGVFLCGSFKLNVLAILKGGGGGGCNMLAPWIVT